MAVLDNPRHERFAQEMAKGMTAAAAYHLAGYKSNRAQATRLRDRPEVAARIAEMMALSAARSTVTAVEVIERFASIARADIRRLFAADGTLLPPADWPDDIAGAIASVKRSPTGIVTVKLWDKPRALEGLARHFGLFNDKIDITGSLDNLTDAELAMFIAMLRSMLLGGAGGVGEGTGEAVEPKPTRAISASR